jgi:hypothetical protein
MNGDVMLVLLDSHGRALQTVGPFESDKAAVDFYYDTASAACHGYTLTSYVTPEGYTRRAQS